MPRSRAPSDRGSRSPALDRTGGPRAVGAQHRRARARRAQARVLLAEAGAVRLVNDHHASPRRTAMQHHGDSHSRVPPPVPPLQLPRQHQAPPPQYGYNQFYGSDFIRRRRLLLLRYTAGTLATTDRHRATTQRGFLTRLVAALHSRSRVDSAAVDIAGVSSVLRLRSSSRSSSHSSSSSSLSSSYRSSSLVDSALRLL